jgi:hypothetical protein
MSPTAPLPSTAAADTDSEPPAAASSAAASAELSCANRLASARTHLLWSQNPVASKHGTRR